jgi:hypothetical protein
MTSPLRGLNDAAAPHDQMACARLGHFVIVRSAVIHAAQRRSHGVIRA